MEKLKIQKKKEKNAKIAVISQEYEVLHHKLRAENKTISDVEGER